MRPSAPTQTGVETMNSRSFRLSIVAAAALVALSACSGHFRSAQAADIGPPNVHIGAERMAVPDLGTFFDRDHDEALDRAYVTFVVAHAGQLSTRDGCHKSKDEGRRHWHLEGTQKAGGACVKRDRRTVRKHDRPPVAMISVPKHGYDDLVAERDRLRGDLRKARKKSKERGRTINQLQNRLGQANAGRKAALRRASDAREDAAAAEARARGHGPAVSPRCARAVSAALDMGRLSWGANAKSKLRRACFE